MPKQQANKLLRFSKSTPALKFKAHTHLNTTRKITLRLNLAKVIGVPVKR